MRWLCTTALLAVVDGTLDDAAGSNMGIVELA
jgi:hypothetical protein